MPVHAVTVALQLRWGDMDSNNHINNVAIARLLEESRIRAIPRLLADDTASTQPRSDAELGNGLVVARQEVEFLASIPYSTDDIVVTVWLSRVGRSSFDLASVLDDASGRRSVQAETTVVCVDSDGVPAPIPESTLLGMRARLAEPVTLRRHS